VDDDRPVQVSAKDPILFYLRVMTATSSLCVILLLVLIVGGAEGQDRINEKMERIARVGESFDARAERVAEKVAPLGDKLLDKGMTAVEQIDPEGIGEEVEEVAQAMKQRLIERIVEGKRNRPPRRQRERMSDEEETTEEGTPPQESTKSTGEEQAGDG